jgi:hypothetical protein
MPGWGPHGVWRDAAWRASARGKGSDLQRARHVTNERPTYSPAIMVILQLELRLMLCCEELQMGCSCIWRMLWIANGHRRAAFVQTEPPSVEDGRHCHCVLDQRELPLLTQLCKRQFP